MLLPEPQDLADLAVREQSFVLPKLSGDRHAWKEALEQLFGRDICGIGVVAGVEHLEPKPVLLQAQVDDLAEIACVDVVEDVAPALRRVREEIRETLVFMRLDHVADTQRIDVETRPALEGTRGHLVQDFGQTIAVHRVDVVVLLKR